MISKYSALSRATNIETGRDEVDMPAESRKAEQCQERAHCIYILAEVPSVARVKPDAG